MTEPEVQQPILVPVGKPLSLIPVGLKEAALDSPTFRATAVHFADQVDAVERWLENYVKSASRLTQEANTLEGVVHSLIACTSPPSQVSEAVLDHDYTTVAMERFGDGAQTFWTNVIATMKKMQISVVEPARNFLSNDIKSFKDARRSLDSTQKTYDGLLSRYFGQAKTKEPSALREDAFQLHEAKKSYLKASMDFSVLAPQLFATLNSLLIRVFAEQWFDMKDIREVSTLPFTKHTGEFTRIRQWSKDTSLGERFSKYDLLTARKEIEETAVNAARPPRDLDYYAASTVPYLGSRPPAFTAQSTSGGRTSKQGWLFLRTLTGKPARTIWIRRWFFVNNGIFGSLVQGGRSGGVEESEKIGVLLCNVRAAFQEERRFCFEVKTKDTTILLQAESQSELTQWIEVFEVSKQKALEEPAVGDPLTSGGNPNSDAAFAVSPAVAPELAARRADGQVANIAEEVQGSLQASDPDGGTIVSRHSMDVKKIVEKADGERNRDHAARLIQKLDLHRKSAAGAQLTTSPSSPLTASPGIASLISASHGAMPVGPGRAETIPISEKKEPVLHAYAQTRLAPSSLANPPAPTNLSRTAITIGAERGLDLGVVDHGGGVPSSIMANQWGTMNYGHLSRLERGEVKSAEKSSSNSASNTPYIRGLSDPPLPSDSLEPIIHSETFSQLPPPSSSGRVRSGSEIGHRKTASDLDTNLPQRKFQGGFADFPAFYPPDLKSHDAQFRMLFPNVPQEDRVILVFLASWNPDERQDLPGRVFVTVNHLYFYSNHYGFVVVSGIALSNILNISCSRSAGHDMLYIRVEGLSGRDEVSLIAMKTFLEPIRLLERRLNYLAKNCSTEEPEGLEEVLRVLIEQESEQGTESYESADDIFTAPGAKDLQRAETNLKVDRSLNYGGDQAATGDLHEPIKFRLPSQPVVYAPKHMDDIAAEGVFDVSAKALFHLMFGDKSVLSQMLYRERRSEAVKQFPWHKNGEGCWSRSFEYEIEALDALRRYRKVLIVDFQIVDVANDHLCYVVTDLKTPWHLPSAKEFSMVTKVVITHVAKSRSKLGIFTKVQWKGTSTFYKNLIRRHAIDDLRLDGQDLLDLVADQVQKLGPDCTTKKTIHIFGQIGHQNEGTVITEADPSMLGRPVRVMIRQRGVLSLVVETLASIGASAASTILMSVIAIGRGVFRIVSMHALLILVLLASISINLTGSSQIASTWWRDRSAANFMSRIGVGPNIALSKTIYLSDLEDVIAVKSGPVGQSTSKCSRAFRNIIAHSDVDAPIDGSMAMYTAPSARSTARRLRRTRQRMGSYRHDLMVSLRLVNGIEREAIQAEYENWLLEEYSKCRRVGSLLTGSGGGGGGGAASNVGAARGSTAEPSNSTRSKLAAQLGTDNVEHVQVWYDEYCASCYREHEVVTSRDVAGSLL